ncbi:MAG: hypothetical protein L0027_05400 [Candidatus Rokubacteria bacterium]|nr:hypothetical protein [Candidatus Rokubacteria bacterium]
MKLALRFSPGGLSRAATARAMLEAQALEPGPPPTVIELPGGAMGYLPTSDRCSRIPLARRSREGNILVVSGVPVDLHGSLDPTLAAIVEQDPVAAGRALSALDGAFAAAFWHERERKLVVVADFLGMQPLYELRASEGLAMATEVKGLAAAGICAEDSDPAGWGTFVGFGFVYEGLSFLRDVRRVPPASITVYDPLSGESQRSTYWRWPAGRPETTLDTVETGALAEALMRQVDAYREHYPGQGTLLMSGGFDSRLVLCALARAGVAAQALVLSNAVEHDDADGRFATRAARALGMAPAFIASTPGFYSSPAYLDYLLASEVSAPSIGLFIAQLGVHVRPELGAVWEGAAPGNSLKTSHQPRGGFEAYLHEEANPLGSERWQAAARVFAPPLYRAMEEGFREAVAEARGRYAADGFGLAEFVVRSRMRNRTALNPLMVFANRVLPFTPGLSKAFWAVAASIPAEVKRGYGLYLRLLERHFPEGLGTPFISGSTMVRAGRGFDPLYLRTRITSRLVRVSYVGGVIRRLGLRPRLVREESVIVEQALARVDPAHPDLHADGVRRLLRERAPGDPLWRGARQYLFYWQIWRWMVDGSLRARYAELTGTRASTAASDAVESKAPPVG